MANRVADRAGAIAGLLFLSLTLLAVARPLSPGVPHWLPGLTGWLAFLLVWHRLKRAQKFQTGLLLGGGLAAGLWGGAQGEELAPVAFLQANVDLVALLTGVGFLRLVTVPPAAETGAAETGRWAFLRTLVGTHLLSSVINLSALFIVADRLLPSNGRDHRVLMPLARAFSAAAFWSPFFAAMGVALTYAPGASLPVLVLHGLPLAVLALAWTQWEMQRKDAGRLAGFVGYPLRWEALWLPLAMVAGVLLLHALLPGYSIILLVAALAMLLSAVVLTIRVPRRAVARLFGHVATGIPRQAGELTLFLAAGVFAVGVGRLFQAQADVLVLSDFHVISAALSMTAMIGLAWIGVHPVISIAMAGAWLEPLALDGNLLGTLFLCVWAIGVVAAPFSGMNLALAGRYGVEARDLLAWHARYVLVMLIAAIGLLVWCYPQLLARW